MPLRDPANRAPTESPERKRARRKEARPSEIVAAALDVFAEKGFAGTKTDDIALRAGISKGTLYLYFPSKEDLLKAVVQDNIVALVNEGRVFVENYEGSAANMLRDFTLEWWRRMSATKGHAIPKLIMSEAGNFPEIATYYYEAVIMPTHIIVGSIFERGVADGEFAPIANIHDAVHSIVAGVMFLVHAHYSLACHADDNMLNPETFLNNHVNTMVLGLAPRLQTSVTPQRKTR